MNDDALGVFVNHQGGTTPELWASRYVPGDGWDASVPIADGGSYIYSHRVAVDLAGNAMCVWNETFDGGPSYVLWNRFTPDGGWEGVKPIQGVPAYERSSPDVAANAAGLTYATWLERTTLGHSSRAFVARYVPGVGWDDAGVVSGAAPALSAHVGVDAAGGVFLFWVEYVGSNKVLWRQRRLADAGWSAAESFDRGSTLFGDQVDFAVSPSGKAIAAWTETTDAGQKRLAISVCR